MAFGAATDVEPNGPTLCPFRLVTGLPCPFCGLTRSMFALGRGDFSGSVHFSPIGPLVAIAAAVLALVLAASIWRGRSLSFPRPVLALGTMILALSWAFQITQGAAP